MLLNKRVRDPLRGNNKHVMKSNGHKKAMKRKIGKLKSKALVIGLYRHM